MSHAIPDSDTAAGRNELGSIDIADRVVQKIAARAAAENPDAGAPATRMLGVALPGAGSDLDKLPKTAVDVDGSLAFVRLQLAVRWPCSVADTSAAVRAHVADRVEELTGLTVQEVDITVTDLVTDIAAPPRVH